MIEINGQKISFFSSWWYYPNKAVIHSLNGEWLYSILKFESFNLESIQKPVTDETHKNTFTGCKRDVCNIGS